MKTFLRFAFAFAFAWSFTSCLTVKKIERNCDKFSKVCTTASNTITIYRDTTIYKTDTLFYKLPPDTVKITEQIFIENNQAILKPIFKKIGFIGVNAWIKNNQLNINAWLTDSTILIPYRDTIYLPDAISNTTTTNTITVTKKHIPGLFKFTFWVVVAALVMGALWFAKNVIPLKFNPFRFRYLKS